MYKRATYRIRSNEPLTETVYRMVVEGDTQYLTAPGQFVNIELPGRFLRRPISVCDYDGHTITLIYKVIGEGTAQMAGMAAGGELDMLTGLGPTNWIVAPIIGFFSLSRINPLITTELIPDLVACL